MILQSGLLGCGADIAHGLARTTLGTGLLDVALTMELYELQAYLPAWCNELQNELQTNAQGQLQRRQPAIANRLSPDFPDINVILQYTKPLSSASTLSSIDRSR